MMLLPKGPLPSRWTGQSMKNLSVVTSTVYHKEKILFRAKVLVTIRTILHTRRQFQAGILTMAYHEVPEYNKKWCTQKMKKTPFLL